MKKVIFFILWGYFSVLNGFLPTSCIARRSPAFYQQAAALSKTITDHLLKIMQKGKTVGYINEAGLSQVGHAEQAANCMLEQLKTQSLSQEEKAELVLAALFHDIGHLCAPEGTPEMDGNGMCDHELIGADHLARLGFSPTVTVLIASHAQAKRYLVSTEPGYLEGLSPASKQTLMFQGGPMTKEECRAFEQSPYFEFKLWLRRCDEAAKDPSAQVPQIEGYTKLISAHLLGQFLSTPGLLETIKVTL